MSGFHATINSVGGFYQHRAEKWAPVFCISDAAIAEHRADKVGTGFLQMGDADLIALDFSWQKGLCVRFKMEKHVG